MQSKKQLFLTKILKREFNPNLGAAHVLCWVIEIRHNLPDLVKKQ